MSSLQFKTERKQRELEGRKRKEVKDFSKENTDVLCVPLLLQCDSVKCPVELSDVSLNQQHTLLC